MKRLILVLLSLLVAMSTMKRAFAGDKKTEEPLKEADFKDDHSDDKDDHSKDDDDDKDKKKKKKKHHHEHGGGFSISFWAKLSLGMGGGINTSCLTPGCSGGFIPIQQMCGAGIMIPGYPVPCQIPGMMGMQGAYGGGFPGMMGMQNPGGCASCAAGGQIIMLNQTPRPIWATNNIMPSWNGVAFQTQGFQGQQQPNYFQLPQAPLTSSDPRDTNTINRTLNGYPSLFSPPTLGGSSQLLHM